MTVKGVDEFLQRLAHAGQLGEQAVTEARDALGQDVAAAAQAQAPVDTGTLRDSIGYGDGVVSTDVEYAPFVEYGTSTNDAQSFMRPAADTVDGEKAAAVAATVMRQA